MELEEAKTSASMKEQNKLRHSHTHPHPVQCFRVLAPGPALSDSSHRRVSSPSSTFLEFSGDSNYGVAGSPRPGLEAQLPVSSGLSILPSVTNSPSVCRCGCRQVTDVPLPATLTLQILHLRFISCFLRKLFKIELSLHNDIILASVSRHQARQARARHGD